METQLIPLWMYLTVSAALLSIGIFGVLSRRNAVVILMGVELMLNAVNINLVAFWRYSAPGINDLLDLGAPALVSGQVFAAFLFVVAAAEAAVGLAIVISVYRNRRSVIVEDVDLLRW
jgi:NADH-quinone oxidoreductase subunit K